MMTGNGNRPYQPEVGHDSPPNSATYLSSRAPVRDGFEIDVEAARRRPGLFSGLSPETSRRIHASGFTKEFRRGDMLFLAGAPVRHIFLLIEGLAKCAQFGSDGSEVILRLAPPGDVLGAVALFTGNTYRFTAEAFRPCRALIWDADGFRHLLGRYPVLHENMAGVVTSQLNELEARFGEVATARMSQRLARQLLRLAEQIGRPADGGVAIDLSREELGLMTGTSSFTVSRLLCGWEERGVVGGSRGVVSVRDIESLRKIAGFENQFGARAFSAARQ